MRKTQKGALALAAALAGLTAVVAPAGVAAAAPSGSGADQAVAARSDAARFTAEAREAGLSTAEIGTLQREVDTYLAQYGGKTVAANKVANRDGSTTLFPLPGEKYAHELNSGLDGNNPRTALASCSYGAFCGYKGANYTGQSRTWIQCGTYEIPDGWNSGGSWNNNQTHQLQAVMRNRSHQPVYVTPPAPSKDSHGNWGPVWFVTNC